MDDNLEQLSEDIINDDVGNACDDVGNRSDDEEDDNLFFEDDDLLDETEQSVSFDKKTVPGLVYISHLPPKMTPLYIRQIFSKYGEVGRVYLQPDERKPRGNKKRIKNTFNHGRYTEGWIEFADKKLAKKIVLAFNNTLIVDGKKKIFRDYTWNLKYLHRFRWIHLTEHLRQQQQTHKQKMRIEISQAKKEAGAFAANAAKAKSIDAIKIKRQEKGEVWNERRRPVNYKQRKTVDQLRLEKLQKVDENESNLKQFSAQRKKVLGKIFGS